MKKICKQKFSEVSEIALFNIIGEYAKTKGYHVVYFKSLSPKLAGDFTLDFDKMEFEYAHYIHLVKNNKLELSIYFDAHGLLSTINTPYYEIYDMYDTERFWDSDLDEMELLTKVKNYLG